MRPFAELEPTPLPAPEPMAGLDRSAVPYPLPEPGAPLRMAIVGRGQRHAECMPPGRARGLRSTFVDYAAHDIGYIRSELKALAPHVVVGFDPDDDLREVLAATDAATLAWMTHPVPRLDRRGMPHPDHDALLSEQRRFDASPYDRAMCVEPLASAGGGPFWRARPLPVGDHLFAPVRPTRHDGRILFVGRSSAHREQWLMKPKHEFELLHYAHGLEGDRLIDVFARADVALNVHPDPYRRFGTALPRHLAAGHLVISEPVVPLHGLEPGIDYIEVHGEHEMGIVLHQLRRRPETYQRVRLRGRAKAELFRASVVWPRIVGDLLRELAVDV